MESAIFGFMGALLGAVLGFIGSVLSTFGKSKDTQLDILTKIITSERAQWRQDMRILTSDLVGHIHRAIAKKEDDDILIELNKTRVLIKLRLNPNEDHKLDKDLLCGLDNILTHLDDDKDQLLATLLIFEDNMQKLIKREWDKSKGEAQSGNIGKSDKNA